MKKKSLQKNKPYYFVILILLITVLIHELKDRQNTSNPTETASFDVLSSKEASISGYLPTSTTGQVITHQYYTLSYVEKHEQSEWVAYTLKPEHLTKDKRERPSFKPDPKVSSGSSKLSNYVKSGYTRGHLLPAADRVFSKEAYDETFYTSNISPQVFEFNAGIWNSLEVSVRNFVKQKGSLFVVTGGILTDNLKTIGIEKVSVPEYFYKIILYEYEGNYHVAAYLIPHKKSKNKSFKDHAVTVNQIEKLTGINFFSTLDDHIEHNLEHSILTDWFDY